MDGGKILKFLGYPCKYEQQQTLLGRVDVDNSGKLSEARLRKLIRTLSEQDLRDAQVAFYTHVSQDGGALAGTLSKEKAAKVLCSLPMPGGQKARPEILPADIIMVRLESGIETERVNLDGFLRLLGRTKRDLRKSFRENGGFSASELAVFKEAFTSFDYDGSGTLENREIATLVETLCPSIAYDQAMRPKLLKMLVEVDGDGNGRLDFSEFILLFREFMDVEEHDRIAKEQSAIGETGFMGNEVSDLRELFVASCKTKANAGIITLDEMTELLSAFCPMGDKNKIELKDTFHEITQSKADIADFPHFLLLMRTLMDDNFAQIQERTGMGTKGTTKSERRQSIFCAIKTTKQARVGERRGCTKQYADDETFEQQAVRLAKRNRLDQFESMRIVRACKRISSKVNKITFKDMLSEIFAVERIDAAIVDSAYMASFSEGKLSIQKFFDWYMQNMFQAVAALNATPEAARYEAYLTSVSRKKHIPLHVVSEIKKVFDDIDENGNGDMEFDEFEELIRRIVSAKTKGDIPECRLRRFWNEARGQDEVLHFEQFVDWYQKYNRDETTDLLTELYASCNNIPVATTLRILHGQLK
jgi:Ca2+-binding EF-hand superfamily protein